jgi:hypothetical protein
MITAIYTLWIKDFNFKEILEWAKNNNMENLEQISILSENKRLFTSYRKCVRTRFNKSEKLPFKDNHILIRDAEYQFTKPFIQMFSLDKVLLFKLTFDDVTITSENIKILDY